VATTHLLALFGAVVAHQAGYGLPQMVTPKFLSLEAAMQLCADDFGCVPDGRVLDSVQIHAGSTQLDVLDGALLPVDVGKHIAVPGAVDLKTTIAELERRTDCLGTIRAGSNQLDATPRPGGPALDGAYRGLRITVAGAGPGGRTLVTDVTAAADAPGASPGDKTFTLAQPAAIAVALADTTLNDPDRVQLGDHARAGAAAFRVDLGDRVIQVAGMTVGQDVLVSPGAGFSSEDLTKTVIVPDAGCLFATIDAITGTNRVSLSESAQRTVSGGPADVWQTDSRPGFELLLGALAGLNVQNADILFRAGVYDFTRAPATSGSLPAALGLAGLHNAMLRGAGQGLTVLRLMPGQDLGAFDTHVLMARGCRGLTVRDLTVNGAYLTLGSVGVQAHGIVVDYGCEDVVVDSAGVFQTAGDAVRLIGESGQNVRRVWVQGCRLVQNKRTGVAFQRNVEFVWVTDCYIETIPPSTQAGIDFEPTGPIGQRLAPADVIIDSNVLLHNTPAVAVSISGRAGDPAQRIRFTNNTLQGGIMGGVNAHDVTISGNTVITGDTVLADDAGQVMWIRGSFDGLRVTDNKIVDTTGRLDGIHLSRAEGIAADGVRISGNDITAAGFGIMLDNPGSQITLSGNRIQGKGQAQAIHVALTGSLGEVRRDLRITGNSITCFADAGIQISTGYTTERIDGMEISDNDIAAGISPGHGNLTGIRFAPPSHGTGRWLKHALVTGNRIADDVNYKIQRDGRTVPFLAVSGNPGAAAIFEGDGTPEGIVAAAPGSIFLRVDNPAAATAYLKAGTGLTGWFQLATV
jgi:hypothetical protein